MRPKKKSPIENSGNFFRQARLKSELSQENLARRLDMAVSTVRRWEKDSCEPTMTVSQMRAFCNAVNIKFEKLPKSLIVDILSPPTVNGLAGDSKN